MSVPVQLTSRNWLGKASAGLVLGFALAIGVSGLICWFGPGGVMGGDAKTQFNMWIVSPVWCLILSFVFLFRDGLRAWLWLGGGAAVVFGLLYGGRALIS